MGFIMCLFKVQNSPNSPGDPSVVVHWRLAICLSGLERVTLSFTGPSRVSFRIPRSQISVAGVRKLGTILCRYVPMDACTWGVPQHACLRSFSSSTTAFAFKRKPYLNMLCGVCKAFQIYKQVNSAMTIKELRYGFIIYWIFML